MCRRHLREEAVRRGNDCAAFGVGVRVRSASIWAALFRLLVCSAFSWAASILFGACRVPIETGVRR